MDIRCVRCGEQWDIDELHYVAEHEGKSFENVRSRFYKHGCVVLGGQECETNSKSAIISALADLSGDDVDGFASDLEDAEWLGLL